MAGAPTLSRAASGNQSSRKNLSRRVSFNESTLKKSADLSKEYLEIDSHSEGLSRSQHRWKSCCACCSLIIGVLILCLLIMAVIYYSFLQSNLPQVRLRRLDVNKLDLTIKKGSFVTADVEVLLNVTNANNKIELSYGTMSVDLSLLDIGMGSMQLPKLSQETLTSNQIKVRTRVNNKPIQDADAKDLKEKSQGHTLDVSVMSKGDIALMINGVKLHSFPFRITCLRIDQTAIDAGLAPKCNVKVSLIN